MMQEEYPNWRFWNAQQNQNMIELQAPMLLEAMFKNRPADPPFKRMKTNPPHLITRLVPGYYKTRSGNLAYVASRALMGNGFVHFEFIGHVLLRNTCDANAVSPCRWHGDGNCSVSGDIALPFDLIKRVSSNAA